MSAAAKVLGINVQTCFHWAYEVGAVTRKPRTASGKTGGATPAQKEEFLAVLVRVGSISVAARETGVPLSQCATWARLAGIKSIRAGGGTRAEYLRLREAGNSRKEAVAAAGANPRSAYRWEIQRKVASAGHDETKRAQMPYNREVITACNEPLTPTAGEVSPPAGPVAVAGPAQAPEPVVVALEALEQPVSARYLSLPERERIADLLARDTSLRAIARALGRSAGSISREIARNSHPGLGYQPYGAHRKATTARARPKPGKLATDGPLREYMKEKLLTRWSPEQISKVLIKEITRIGYPCNCRDVGGCAYCVAHDGCASGGPGFSGIIARTAGMVPVGRGLS